MPDFVVIKMFDGGKQFSVISNLENIIHLIPFLYNTRSSYVAQCSFLIKHFIITQCFIDIPHNRADKILTYSSIKQCLTQYSGTHCSLQN